GPGRRVTRNGVVDPPHGAFQLDLMQGDDVLRRLEYRYQRLGVDLVGPIRALNRRCDVLAETTRIEVIRGELGRLPAVLEADGGLDLAGGQLDHVTAQIDCGVPLGVYR